MGDTPGIAVRIEYAAGPQKFLAQPILGLSVKCYFHLTPPFAPVAPRWNIPVRPYFLCSYL